MGKKQKDPNVSNVGEKKKHYWWRYLLTFLGGMATMLGATVAAIFITLTAIPVSKLTSGLKTADGQSIIDKNYESMTLLDFGIAVITDIKNGNIYSINGIAKYSPIVKETIEKVAIIPIETNFNCTINKEAIYSATFSDIGNVVINELTGSISIAGFIKNGREFTAFTGPEKEICFNKNTDGTYDYDNPRSIKWFQTNMNTAIQEVGIASVLEINYDSASDLLKYVLFDENHVQLCLKDFQGDEAINKILKRIPLNVVVDPANNKILNYLIYPKTSEGELDKNNPRTVGDLIGNGLENLINNAELGDLLDISEDSILINYKNTKIVDLGNVDIGELTVAQAFGSSLPNSGVLYLLRDSKLKNIQDDLYELKLGQLIESDSAIIASISNYTLNDLVKNPDTVVDSIKLGDVFGNATSPILVSLSKYTIGEFKVNSDTIIKGLKLSEVIDVGDTGILKALDDLGATIGDLDSKIQELKVSDIVDIDPNNKLLNAIKDCQIKNLGTELDTLTIDTILGDADPDEPYFLTTMRDWKLNEVAENSKKLTISEIFSKKDLEENRFLQAIPSDTLISDIPDAINDILVEEAFYYEVFGEHFATLDEYKEASNATRESYLTSEWKYMLTEPNKTYSESKKYTIADIDELVTNFKENINNATLNELSADGIVTMDNSILDKVVPDLPGIDESLKGAKFGTLTLTQFTQVVSIIIG